MEFPAAWIDPGHAWLTALAAAGRLPSTIETRRRKLRAFAAWVGKPPTKVTVMDCEAWMGRPELSSETRKGIRATLSEFFQWACDRGVVSVNPAADLPKAKQSRPHPRPCPDSVILRALSRATPSETVMLRLGAECGLRRFEIAKVHSADVMDDLLGRSLVVRGKGDVQRIVPISDDLAEEVIACDGYVFPGRWGGHVEASYVGRHLACLLGKPWTAHSLRHRYATVTYSATHDIYLVSQLLGHASVKTTMSYVAMPDERLRSGMAAVRLTS
ncbi:tyrosine-type recombinase/integrase [Bifidobacterium phasiani]|nr:tyrosine-type recombinase/integrase [Bifidobacterium phasiani]